MNRITVVLVGVAAALAGGCDSTEVETGDSSSASASSNTEMVLVARTDPPILDIPVPVGLELADPSRNRSAAGVRWIDHFYEGRADKFAAVRFYKRQMQRKGWTLMSSQYVDGRSTLSFEKKMTGLTEEALVSIYDAGLWSKIRVHVAVGPRGPMAIPASP